MVHESEAVSEFMHESSDTGGEAVAQSVFLVAAGVAVDVHSVFGLHLHSPFIHGEGVGPDGVGVVGVGRTLSGVVDIDVVDVSVAVVVILREVHLVVDSLHYSLHECSHVYRSVVCSVAGVMLSVVYLHRTVYIECWLELSVRACYEEVSGTAGSTVDGGESLFVHRFVVVFLWVLHCGERLVVELHQDDYRVLLSEMGEVVHERLFGSLHHLLYCSLLTYTLLQAHFHCQLLRCLLVYGFE